MTARRLGRPQPDCDAREPPVVTMEQWFVRRLAQGSRAYTAPFR